MAVEKSPFGTRLKAAFNNAVNIEIADKLGVTEGAVSNYVRGRIPDAEKLLEIANITKCNLHWLLTGEGDRDLMQKPLDLTDALRATIRDIVKEELAIASRTARLVMPLEVGDKADKKARKSG